MKRLLRHILIFVCIVVLATAGMVAWRVRPKTVEFYTDADSIKERPETAVIREILWTPPKALSEKLNTTADDYEPRLSADGQTLFFVRGKAGANAEIYWCSRTLEGWSDPAPLAIVNTPSDELGPEVSADGESLYFYSDRPGSLGGYDLWVSHKGKNGWRAAINLGPRANSPYNDYGPAISPDGRTLYFASNRPTSEEDLGDSPPSAWSATIREDRQHRDYDLYASDIADGGVGQAVPLDAVNTEHDEGSPAVSTYGDFLYFASNRTDGSGGFDLYRSRRIQGAIRPAENLGPAVNTPANELDPDLSLGGYSLHFSSDRAAHLQADQAEDNRLAATHETGERPDYNLYYTTSREVYRDAETQKADIDWAGLWAEIGPNLLWALLALLLTILLLILLRDFRERKLSLLARCLLASVMAHLLLMLLLNVVEVSAGLMTALRGRGKIKVALVSNAVAGELTSQIRGELTQVSLPAPEVATSTQQEFETRIEPPSPMASLPVERTTVPLNEPTITIDHTVDAPIPSEDAAEWKPNQAVAAQSSTAPPLDLAMPDDGRPMQEAEQEAPSTPPIVTSSVERSSSVPAATTQPVIPTAQYAVEPARGAVLPPEMLPSMSIENPALRDATPKQIEPALAWAQDREAASVPLPQTAIALPDETRASASTSAAASREDDTPHVEMASLAAPRADAALPMHGDEPATMEPSQIQPERVAQTPPEVVSSGLPKASPRDAAVIEAAEVSLQQAPTPAALTGVVSLDDMRLPAEAATSPRADEARQAKSSTADAVVPDAADHIREALPLAARVTGAEPLSETIHLAPEGVKRSVDTSAEPATSAFSPTDTATPATAETMSRDPSTLAAATPTADAGLPTLELNLPTETEPPGLREIPGHAVGVIFGRVADTETLAPLAGATIRLVLPDDQTIVVQTDEDGMYELAVPPVPEFFALSASSDGYVPATSNIAAAMLTGRQIAVDFALARETEWVVAIEEEPDVHHLGNDRFTGRINSQFQKESEGRRYHATFELRADQLPPNYTEAEVWLMVRGVQCPHVIRINKRRLRQRLNESPDDGSFGPFTAPFDPVALKAGTNRIEILAKSCQGDLDDFEFVNVQIRLRR